jgi:hypothetical protein
MSKRERKPRAKSKPVRPTQQVQVAAGQSRLRESATFVGKSAGLLQKRDGGQSSLATNDSLIGAALSGQGGLIADPDLIYVVPVAGTKHPGRVRYQWGPVEFAQEALRKISNRNELSQRKLTAAANDILARDERGFRARFGNRKLHRKTVMRAKKALDGLDH